MTADHESEARCREVADLAEDIFESRTVALDWMAAPNPALGGLAPQHLCGTEAGAQQVRRVLRALESGGVV